MWTLVKASYEEKESPVGSEVMRQLEKQIGLNIVDVQWKDHLYSLDHLKEGIGLRGYGQRDPLVEYKKESFALFQDMRGAHRRRDRPATCSGSARWSTGRAGAGAGAGPAADHAADDEQSRGGNGAGLCRGPGPVGGVAAVATPPRPARTGGDDVIKTVRREEPKVGRNDPCPCGSGKKYKKCHGAGT